MIFFKDKKRFTLAFCSILFIFLFFGSITDTAVAIQILKPFAAVDIKMAGSFLAVCIAIVLIIQKINESVVEKLLKFWLIYCVAVLFYFGRKTIAIFLTL